jgi:hypothetical protein
MTQATCTAYRNPPEMEKLSQIRAKTDRQLRDFIHSKLDEAAAELSQGNRAEAQESLVRAERAVAEAQTLLLLLSPQQRRGFDRKLHEISDNLARVCRDQELLRPLFFIA